MKDTADFEIEQFLVDELDGADTARVAAAIERDADLAAYVALRRASQQAFIATSPQRPVPVAQVGPARAQRRVGPADDDRGLWERIAARWTSLVPALAAAAALVVFVSVPRGGDDGGTAGVVARGEALPLTIVVRRGDAVFRHAPGMLVRGGDALRFEATTARALRCTVVGEDARAAVTVLAADVPLPAGRSALAMSFVLDDAPGPERFVVACGDRAPASDVVVRAIRTADVVKALGPGTAVATVTLDKEPTP